MKISLDGWLKDLWSCVDEFSCNLILSLLNHSILFSSFKFIVYLENFLLILWRHICQICFETGPRFLQSHLKGRPSYFAFMTNREFWGPIITRVSNGPISSYAVWRFTLIMYFPNETLSLKFFFLGKCPSETQRLLKRIVFVAEY